MLSLPKTFRPKCTKNHNHLKYGTWDMEWDRKNFFSFWAILCPFTPLLTPKIKIWKKCKRKLEILSYYTHVYHIWWLYDVWFLQYKTWWTEFFVILGHFLPSDPPNNPKNQNIEKKNEKKSRDIIILQMCTIHENQMMHGSWDMECDKQNFLSFWTIFSLLPPNNPQNQNFEKMKKMLRDIIILHKCTINNNHIMHGSSDMKWDRQSYLSFWTIFCPFTPLRTKKSKFWKNEKTPGDIIFLHKCTKNHDYMLHCSWDMARDGCNYISFWVIFCPFTPLTAQKPRY